MDNLGNKYDLIILGTGPAGLTAGLYSTRYKLKTLAIGQIDGGMMSESHKICNFPTEKEISGFDLTQKMKENAVSQGMDFKRAEVVDVVKIDDKNFEITVSNNNKFYSKAVLFATGTVHRKLNLPNEDKLLGRGVSYCATCDGMFYRNKKVAVVGGGDSAVTSALYMSEISEKVYLIYRGNKLKAEPIWVEKISKKSNVEIIFETNIKEFLGDSNLEKVILDKKYLDSYELNIDGVFVEIGTEPKYYDYLKKFGVELDEQNYIKVDQAQKTNVSGIWAAGDVTTGSNKFRQIITACSEGAVSSEDIFKYIQSNF